MSRRTPNVFAVALGGAALALACAGDPDKGRTRGRGLERATLPVAEQTQIYTSAMRASFDFTPDLTLLLEPSMLPGAGYAAGDTLDTGLRRALLSSPAFQGVCTPDRTSDRARVRGTPTCRGDRPGYVVRLSEIFRMPGDTMQTYALAERYDTPASGTHQKFRLEEAYQLVRRDGAWRVVRKARVARE